MLRIIPLLVFLLCGAPLHAAAIFAGTFSGSGSGSFAPDHWLSDFMSGGPFTGSVSLEEGAGQVSCNLVAENGAELYCGGSLLSYDTDPLTGLVTSLSATDVFAGGGGSNLTLSNSGGSFYYADDSWYPGWENGAELYLSFGPVTRTDVVVTPLPASVLLLAAGVGTLGAAARRRTGRRAD